MPATFDTLLKLTALGAIALATSSCGRLQAHRGYIMDPVLASSVQPGVDNKQSVQGTLGDPTFKSQFGQEEWFYVSRNTRQLAFAEPTPTAQTILHITFDPSGNVAAVDRTGLEQVVSINPEGDKTPTRGRERSFFEELFGNIGTVGAPGIPGGGNGPSNDPTNPGG
ncbi:outer membrane protein assembly factor BamE [Novosphingopyxis sp.]|uniref:outer membrane protein assembly factor BamE n=1 Tax=Novosphingopyxis sp. TaxID=2709690 RepID=UPI003B5CAF4B